MSTMSALVEHARKPRKSRRGQRAATTERALRIAAWLFNGEAVTTALIRERLGASKASAKRDLARIVAYLPVIEWQEGRRATRVVYLSTARGAQASLVLSRGA